MFSSVKFKIITAAVLIISIIMFLSTWRDIKDTEQKLVNGQMEKALLLSERITHGIMVLMLKNRWQDLQTFLESLTKDSDELKGIRIFHPDSGRIVASSSRDSIGETISEQEREITRTERGNAPYLSERNGSRYASKLTVIQNQPLCYGCHDPKKINLGVLGVDISLTEVNKSLDEFKKKHLLHAGVGFLLIVGGFFVLVTMLIDRPIKKMIHTIREIEKGDTAVRMEEDKKDEFGLLAKSFNSMLESLEMAKQEIESCHAEQMQRAAKLASLGEIIAGIVHEIKNPLTGISCAVQVLQSEMQEDDSRKAVAAEILLHIKRLDRTVKDLLNYARPKPPSFQRLPVSDALNKAVFFVYPEASKHNVAIDTDVAREVPDVMMDTDQMQQVFLNLMINAVQAMTEGGMLKIRISNSDNEKRSEGADTLIPSDLQEHAVVITFEDTGKGIEKEYLDNIFDPFFTKKSKGTGLGLAISRRIVQEHGGEITVMSEAGRGSIFTVYLPVFSGNDAPSIESGPRNSM